ncbi:TDRD1 protein, partial [Centropus bengalensis]|nr:TDRD1 protein [Centropus bengalensis]
GSLRCSQCKQTFYCSVDCQKEDWPAHSTVCKPVQQKGEYMGHRQLFFIGCLGISVTCLSFFQEQDCLLKVKKSTFLHTEEHKKIMLSDLQTLGVKKAMEVQGGVTEFKSLSEFYVNSPEVVDHFSKLSVKLQDCYANAVIKEQYVAIKGEVCFAKCSLDQVIFIMFLRAFSPFFYNANNCLSSLVLIVILRTFKGPFANYDKNKKGWNEGTASFSSLLMGKHCSVTVVDILQEETMPKFAVDTVRPENLFFPLAYTVSENRSKGSKGKTAEEFLHCPNSDAAHVTVCVGDVFSGVVSCIQNPENFFCQQEDSARRLAELQVSLSEHCDRSPSNPAFHPATGNVCCAQFTEDDLWYRAAVIAYVSEDRVLAAYIDYGNIEVLPVTRLRPMIPRLMDLPAQAIRCTLAGVKPPSEAWASEAISLMKQLVKDKVFTVKIVNKESYRSVVELIDASVTPVMNISNYLIERGCAAAGTALPILRMSDVKQAEEDTARRLFKWTKLTLKQTVDVIVCTLYSPGEFYCQVIPNDKLVALNSLNESMSEYCQKTPPNLFKPKIGEPCCAFFSNDGNWYRALVRNVTASGNVKVFFVDYGNVDEVPLDKIRQISSSFLELPFRAIKCWLSGIKPASSKWIPEATAIFRAHIAGITLQARITSLSKDGAGVELIDNSTGHPKVINEILASEKLAVKEVLPDKKNFPNKADNKKVHCIFLLFLLETSLGLWKSIEFDLGETVLVCVTEFVSPDLFYAVPAESKDQEKLERQSVELENYCKSCEKQLFKPKAGEACCARFSGDGRWYRAVVLKTSRAMVEVLYADYGSTEMLPLSKVLPITDSYLKLPFQTILCSLAGIEKADWSSSLHDRLKEMLLNKYVTITVKGIKGNVNLVTVEKPCDNGSENVLDKLVTEGLVKSHRTENVDTEHQDDGGKAKCCCAELKMQLQKHEQILLFLLNKYGNPDGFAEMKKLLDH